MILFRSSHWSCSVRKGALRNFAKISGKHLCQSLFFNKVTGLRPATLLKKRLWNMCFPVNFAKFLRTPFLQNTFGRLLLPIIGSSATKHPNRRQYLNWDSKNALNSIHSLSKVNKLANLLHTLGSWLALKQIFAIRPSNLSLLLIVRPKSLTSLLSHMSSSPIFAQLCSYFVQETSKWHSSVFSFMELFSNRRTPSSELLFNFSRTLSSFSLQTNGLVSSAKLQILMSFKKRKGHLNK